MLRFAFGTLAIILSLGRSAPGQTTYTWNNAGTDWNTPANWSPNTGTPGGNTGDFAQFSATTATTISNPILNTNQSFNQLNVGSSPTAGWSLSGTGSLTLSGTAAAAGATSLSQSGLVTRAGGGTYSINLGNGTATSLTLSGATGNAGGALNVGSGSTLLLTGNTVAATSGTAVTSIRGGSLVLDNSAGNPTSQRYTTANAINLNGGGSTLELRGAAAGTTFSGMTGAFNGAGAGDTYLRTVQNGSGSLAVNFASLGRGNTAGNHFFENIGTGFIGDTGKPTVTFATAPTTRQGVISTSASTTIPWAAVTSRSTTTSNDVVGRWANYSSGIVAATTTAFTGDFGAATAGTNVLYNPTTAGTVNQGATANQLASVVFEPGVAGATYNIGTGQINTLAIMHSGVNDFTVTGGSLFSTGTAGTRALAVVNPTSALFTNSNLAGSASPVTTSGPGFVILTGTTNQVAFSSTQNFNLGGVLRVTSTNFDLTTAAAPTLRFRGGVLEYDVSGANTTFNRSLGAAAGNLNWTSNAGYAAATNVGSGGFSAYAGAGNGNGNTLTVNIGNGATPTLFWNDQAGTGAQLFLTDGYALKFGSLRSNATVVFQNNIALDGSSGSESANATNTVTFNRTREFNVTRGVGNAADLTRITGVITGTVTSDLVKTGTGVLELAGSNTYLGSTIVQSGELRVSGSISGNASNAGNVIVGSGATLTGTGTIVQATGRTTVLAGGTIRGDSGTGTGTLALGNTSLLGGSGTSGATLAAQLAVDGNGAITANSQLAVSTNTFNLDLSAGKVNIRLLNDLGLTNGQSYTRTLVTGTGGTNNFLRNGTAATGGNAYTVGDINLLSGSGTQTFSVTAFGVDGNNNLVLTFTPVPEPATVLAIGAAGLAAARWVRRRHKATETMAA